MLTQFFAQRLLGFLKQFDICPVFNIPTRQAVEAKWKHQSKIKNLAIAFIDIDFMHDLNAKYGYVEVDRRIAEAFKVIRRDELISRFYSGDEFILLVPAEHIGLVVQRLMTAFHEQGISATCGIIQHVQGSKSLAEAVKPAQDLVQELKRQGIRGVVLNEINNNLELEPTELPALESQNLAIA
jgi:GGDEF domain-containing protein